MNRKINNFARAARLFAYSLPSLHHHYHHHHHLYLYTVTNIVIIKKTNKYFHQCNIRKKIHYITKNYVYRFSYYDVKMPSAKTTRKFKRNTFRLAKQLCTCITLFCTFLFAVRPLHGYDVNCIISRFIDNVNIDQHTTTNSFFSLNLNIFLKNSTPGKFAYIGKSE